MSFSLSVVPPSSFFADDREAAVAKAETVARELGCAVVRISAKRGVLFQRGDDGTIETYGDPADLRRLGVGEAVPA